jgi:hypothetical protein
MKKIKKDRNKVWKIATGAMAVCLLILGSGFWHVLREISELNRQLGSTRWEVIMMQTQSGLQVSDDGKWFLIPEVRIRIPFFSQVDEDGFYMRAPRYTLTGAFLGSGETAVSFSDSIDGNSIWDEEFPFGCMYPWIFRIDSTGEPPLESSLEYTAMYETVREINLMDGRKLELQVRTAGPSWCMKMLESDWKRQMIEYLSRAESY